MKLLTKELESKLPPLYHYERTKTEPIAVVKFFDPCGSWSWFAAEGEKQPDGDWLLWGLVHGFEAEMGYFSLSELQHCKDGVTGLASLPIERDLYFTPTPLHQFKHQAVSGL